MSRTDESHRRSARIGILSPGTSQFDSRAHRIARSCVERGDTVTIYSRRKRDAPVEEWVDGYRIVRIPLGRTDVARVTGRSGGGSVAANGDDQKRPVRPMPPARRILRTAFATTAAVRATWVTWSDRIPLIHRFRAFPLRPMGWARWFERQVEPHDIWHGMWAGSLPALGRVKRRHGGRTLYDARDVYLRARQFGSMPGWQRRILTWFERRWARAADAVIQVSDPYAAMMRRDLGLRTVPVVRNCPDRWDPPTPRPDMIRERLGLPRETAIVLYQGGLLTDRGIEEAMDAILEVPDAVLVLMGFGNQEDRYRQRSARMPYAGKVHVIEAVPPQQLLTWSASSDVMVMLYQPNTENHEHVTPQKLWEAMAAGVPVVASDLPGFRAVVPAVDCGVLCDPTSSSAVAAAIRALLATGPDGLRARGERGLAAAHATYNWAAQFQVLDEVYARLLRSP